MSDIYDRPRQTMDCYTRTYPGVWKQFESLRANARAHGNWPIWCFVPLGLVEETICRRLPLHAAEQYKHAPVLGALAAWRWTQGIYRFDPSTFDALWNTPITGEIPMEVLYCLPEWCVFIPTPGKIWLGSRLNGFFAHLDYNRKMQQVELRLMLNVLAPNGDSQSVALPIMIGTGGVAESLATTLKRTAQPDPLGMHLSEQERAMAMTEVPALVSLVLYLCSENAEIRESGGSDRRPAYAVLKKTKKGLRLDTPDRPTHWLVGYRIGAALRRASSERSSEEPTGTHARPRPHIRRAHWHSYWVGKWNDPDTRIVVLKWLPPIAVNVKSVDDLTTTVRDVGHASVTQTAC
jgi:hypothetical protein